MLKNLKALLEADETPVAIEGDLDISDRVEASSIRDLFLSGNKEAVALGADNDPTISKFIESIPEDDELDPVSQEEIDKITESMIPVMNEAYTDESDDAINDYISSGDYSDGSEFDEMPTDEGCEGCDESYDTDTEWDETVSEASYKQLADYESKGEGSKLLEQVRTHRTAAAKAERDGDTKKAISEWKTIKSLIQKIKAGARKNIGDDKGFLDRFMAIMNAPWPDKFSNSGTRGYAMAVYDNSITYCDYMIDKLSGKKVGFFKDYYTKAFKTILRGLPAEEVGRK